jgi:hypothetical protein
MAFQGMIQSQQCFDSLSKLKLTAILVCEHLAHKNLMLSSSFLSVLHFLSEMSKGTDTYVGLLAP